MIELSSSEISALDDALNDEYQAWATYDQLIADFGDVMPRRTAWRCSASGTA